MGDGLIESKCNMKVANIKYVMCLIRHLGCVGVVRYYDHCGHFQWIHVVCRST